MIDRKRCVEGVEMADPIDMFGPVEYEELQAEAKKRQLYTPS